MEEKRERGEREGGRGGGKEGGRERETEGGREGGREEERGGGKEGSRNKGACHLIQTSVHVHAYLFYTTACAPLHH